MRRAMRPGTALWMASLCGLLLAGRAAAAGPCADGTEKVGDLGVRRIECDCSFLGRALSRDGHLTIERSWVFRSEPRVGAIAPDGPAAGRLREGDVITTIDGALITTRAGGRRFTDVKPGVPVTLTVRRDRREFSVAIVPGAICPEYAPGGAPNAPPVTTEPPQPPSSPRAPEVRAGPRLERGMRPPALPAIPSMPAPRVEETAPRGWTGFGLRCERCGGRIGAEGAAPVWAFGSFPEIYFVDPESPAAGAGFEAGDVLTHIDGVSLVTEDGGRRFGALRPGQKVTWSFRRGGTVRTASVVTEPRPEERVLAIDELKERLRALSEIEETGRLRSRMEELSREFARLARRSQAPEAAGRRLRYAGSVGGSAIEVRGLGNVVVDDSGDEIVITTRDATIRVRRAAGPGGAAAPPR